MAWAPLTPRLPPQWPSPSLSTLGPLIKELGAKSLWGEKQEVETTAGVQKFPGTHVSTSLTTAP